MASSAKYSIELLDETLDINATGNYDLSIQLTEEGLSYAVLDLLRGKFVLFRHFRNSTPSENSAGIYEEIIKGDDFLTRDYRKVFLLLPGPYFTLVPDAVYDPLLKKEYFRFNHPIANETPVYTNPARFPGATVIFSSENETADLATSHWKGIIPWNHTAPLLHQAWMSCRSSDDIYISIHFERTFITIIIVEKKNLVFCNSFECHSPSDSAFYLFNVLERKEIPKDATIYVSGSLEPYSEGHITLLNFASSVKFATPAIRHDFSYVMHDLALHKWLNLFTIPSCE